MAAPKNNKYALGNSGKPKMFNSPDDMYIQIQEYFKQCDKNVLKEDRDGNKTTEPYTIEGLALCLGCDTDTLLNYEKKEGYEEYFGTIKEAKLRIQKQKVINGLTGVSNSTITIFDLKNNHGYKDKTETDLTTKGESINKTIELPEGQTIDDLKKEIQEGLDEVH